MLYFYPPVPLDQWSEGPFITQELIAMIAWLAQLGYRCFLQSHARDAPILSVTSEHMSRCAVEVSRVPHANLLCAYGAEVLGALRGVQIAADDSV